MVVLGGTVAQDDLSCSGPIAASSVRRYRAEVAVLGAAGLSSRHGLTELDDETAEIHRLIIEQSDRLIVLADGSKFDADGRATVAPVDAIDVLVTRRQGPGRRDRRPAGGRRRGGGGGPAGRQGSGPARRFPPGPAGPVSGRSDAQEGQ